jgi:redox-sensitive bicupin YhaK (pirin superfamily)
LHNVIINDSKFDAGEFVEFDREAGSIEINNISGEAIDILLFGGEESVEPIVAQGPFVMNTPQEISQAYHDFHAGKYGEIKYNKASTEKNSRCIKSRTLQGT